MLEVVHIFYVFESTELIHQTCINNKVHNPITWVLIARLRPLSPLNERFSYHLNHPICLLCIWKYYAFLMSILQCGWILFFDFSSKLLRQVNRLCGYQNFKAGEQVFWFRNLAKSIFAVVVRTLTWNTVGSTFSSLHFRNLIRFHIYKDLNELLVLISDVSWSPWKRVWDNKNVQIRIPNFHHCSFRWQEVSVYICAMAILLSHLLHAICDLTLSVGFLEAHRRLSITQLPVHFHSNLENQYIRRSVLSILKSASSWCCLHQVADFEVFSASFCITLHPALLMATIPVYWIQAGPLSLQSQQNFFSTW